MKTRREFLTAGAAAVAVALVPVAPAAAAAETSKAQSDHDERAEALSNEYRRYATRAALAQANALSIL